MTLVVDASAAYAALTDAGPQGRAIRSGFRGEFLCAPSVFSFEVAATLRRNEYRGDITSELAEEAHTNLRLLRVTEVHYSLLAKRAWELRYNVTVTDAAYVALAEMLDGVLVTVDARLARAPGIRCRTWLV